MFIQISNTISIKAESIESIVDYVDQNDLNVRSKVYTHHNDYLSTLPRVALIDIIKFQQQQEPSIDQQELNILKQQANFAG